MSNKITYNVYYENEQGNVLINTLTENQREALHNYLEGKINEINFKNSKIKLVRNGNLIVLIIANSHKIQVSKQNLENYYSLVSDVVSNIDESIQKVKDDTRRILHNVVSLNSINNQEFDSIFSPEELEGLSHKKMITHMSTKIKNSSTIVAKSILKINKNSYEIKYELDVFKYLINPNSVLRKSKQNIHRVTKRILDTFFLDFLDKEIKVNLTTQDDKVIECDLNFDCLRYAIYNNFDNALKYCKPESEVDVHISLEDGKILIEFNMISLKVNKNEVDKIFIEGYCGDSAKQIQLSGDGVGLYMTKRILSRINSTITFSQREEYTYNSIQYQRNIFTICINLNEK